MIHHLPKVFLGVFITWLVMKKKVGDLKFEKDLLLDFNEKQIREREQMESDLQDSRRMLAAHLEHFECRGKAEEDQILEAEFVE